MNASKNIFRVIYAAVLNFLSRITRIHLCITCVLKGLEMTLKFSLTPMTAFFSSIKVCWPRMLFVRETGNATRHSSPSNILEMLRSSTYVAFGFLLWVPRIPSLKIRRFWCKCLRNDLEKARNDLSPVSRTGYTEPHISEVVNPRHSFFSRKITNINNQEPNAL